MAGDTEYRIERDSMGEVRVPAAALYGAQTQRAVDNFPVSGLPMPRPFIRALGLIKASAAVANAGLKQLEQDMALAIEQAASEVAEGVYDKDFPVDVFQTGSGTSSNMNANEVIAMLASERLGRPVHPNDHVNCGQSSNDVIPTAVHVSSSLEMHERLFPALDHLANVIQDRGAELDDVVKTGRTHLMDAMPVTFGQELGGWAAQLYSVRAGLDGATGRLHGLAQGGTAVGTGINSHPDFPKRFADALSDRTGIRFSPAADRFAAISSQDTAVEVSGQLRALAVVLMKIGNDLRWMNSGPLHGLSEIQLPELQPGSSIMPGKVNPVVPESVTQVCAQVIGNDLTVTIGGQSGNFQLNVMLPVIAYNLLQSVALLSGAMRLLADKAIAGFTVNESHIQSKLDRNPILVTALNDVIGYEKGAAIAKEAYRSCRPIKDVAAEMSGLSTAELDRLLDPKALTKPSAD